MIIYKLGIFKDTVLDRQITALVEAANNAAVPVESVPTPPTALSAVGRMFAIELNIAFPRADNVQAEVWVSATNDRAAASLLGTSVDGIVQHQGLAAGDTRYYWARSITSPSGYFSTWYPASNTAGVSATTVTNATSLIHLLNSNVDDTKLLDYLANGTSLLDVLDTHSMLFEVGSIGTGITATYTEALANAASQMGKNKNDITALNEQIAGLANVDYDNAVTYSVGQFVKYGGLVYQCIATTTGNLPTDTAYWITSTGIVGLISDVQTNLDAATATWTTTATGLAADISGIDTRLIAAESTITVSVDEITLVTTSIIGSLAVTEVGVVEPGVFVSSVSDVPSIGMAMSQAKISLDTQTGRIDLLSTRVDGAENRISAAEIDIDANAAAINLKASTAYVTATYQTLSAAQIAIDATNAAIALKASQSSLDITNGIVTTQSGELDVVKDRITMKLDSNGRVAGMVMGWAQPDVSEIIFLADIFKICQPDGSGVRQVFTVGNIGGVPTVGINGSLVVLDATIDTAQIADAAITTAKIGSAQITTALIADASINSALIADASIGTAHIVNATITGAKIQDAAIDTLQLAGQAVTIPLGAKTGAASWEHTTVLGGAYVDHILASVTLVQAQANPALVSGCAALSGGGIESFSEMEMVVRWDSVKLTRDGTELITLSPASPPMVLDNPGAGMFTYDLVGTVFMSDGGVARTWTVNRDVASIGAVGFKR